MKVVKMHRDLEGKNPDAIRRREEIAHTQKRKAMSSKSLEKSAAQQKEVRNSAARLTLND